VRSGETPRLLACRLPGIPPEDAGVQRVAVVEPHPEAVCLADVGPGFVRYKRTQGLKYADVPRTLRALSRFIASTGQTEMAISQELADQ
jgi:hypothetical protein